MENETKIEQIDYETWNNLKNETAGKNWVCGTNEICKL
jgi:hypothetical protein